MLEKSKYKRFSENKVRENKVDTPVYRYGVVSDRYGNETYAYPTDADFEISLMWTPITSQVEIAEYGERINEMLQGYLFSDEDLSEKDRVLINDVIYNIVSIKKYPHFRILLVERVR